MGTSNGFVKYVDSPPAGFIPAGVVFEMSLGAKVASLQKTYVMNSGLPRSVEGVIFVNDLVQKGVTG